MKPPCTDSSLVRLSPACPSLALLALLFVTGCGGGGGGGGAAADAALAEREPNGSAATAKALAIGKIGSGHVTNPADVDFWALELVQDEVITIEVFGTRLDQASWSLGPTAPRLTLFDVDGVTELRAQGADSFDWGTDQDTDLLFFRVPADGTYFARIAVDNPIASGGEYLLAVRDTSLAAPLQLELEPAGFSGSNDDELTAEPIAPGTVLGQYVDDEEDWYAFAIAEPSLVRLTLSAHRNGICAGDDDVFDPTLTLFDAALAQLDANDDAFYLDSALRYLVVIPGTYFVQVAECCGTGDAEYALEFELEPLSGLPQVNEVEPNDALGTGQTLAFDELVVGTIDAGNPDHYVVPCNAGDRLWIEIYDLDTHQGASAVLDVLVRDALGTVLPSDTGAELRTLRTILPTSGDFSVRVASNVASDYALRIRQLAAENELEPNDVVAQAQAFDLAGRRAGAIETPGDVDLFAFQATRRVPVVFVCFADDVLPDGFFELNGFGSALDPVLRVRDAAGNVLASVLSSLGTALGTNDGLPSLGLAFLPPATGTYYLEVADELGNSGADFRYVIEQR